MSSQMHGVRWEDVVKATRFFTGASNRSRSNTSIFDIESEFDRRGRLPTNIKSTKTSTICLADARRFVSIECDYRMVVGCYTQETSTKSFNLVYEFIMSREAHKALIGALTPDFVECFHNIISMRSLPNYADARSIASCINKVSFLNDLTDLSLNPKIDSKSQRRLQCSVSIDTMKKHSAWTEFREDYSDLVLPFKIKSLARILESEED